MKWRPAVQVVMEPARLPVFDDSWKPKCRTCTHFDERTHFDSTGRKDSTSMCCTVTGWVTPTKPLNCITAREEGGVCGPDATRWEAA
jgi:hypothetical protein